MREKKPERLLIIWKGMESVGMPERPLGEEAKSIAVVHSTGKRTNNASEKCSTNCCTDG